MLVVGRTGSFSLNLNSAALRYYIISVYSAIFVRITNNGHKYYT